jgi:hypothetical protein
MFTVFFGFNYFLGSSFFSKMKCIIFFLESMFISKQILLFEIVNHSEFNCVVAILVTISASYWGSDKAESVILDLYVSIFVPFVGGLTLK